MDQQAYRAYLDCFNRRDYDGVLAHFSDDPEIGFAGYAFRGRETIRAFYAFFHDHVTETIAIRRFVSDADMIAIEAVVRLEGRKDLTHAALEARGLGRLVPLAAGQIVEIPQFIHYHLRDGKFTHALCAVFEAGDSVDTACW